MAVLIKAGKAVDITALHSDRKEADIRLGEIGTSCNFLGKPYYI